MTRIDDKIRQIEEFIRELEEIAPASFEEYREDLTKRAACERYVEKIVESTVDLAFLMVKTRNLRIPEDDIDSFSILQENKIIKEDLAQKLKQAKGMRNIISHQYGRIDDEIVFTAVSEELRRDVHKFLDVAKHWTRKS